MVRVVLNLDVPVASYLVSMTLTCKTEIFRFVSAPLQLSPTYEYYGIYCIYKPNQCPAHDWMELSESENKTNSLERHDKRLNWSTQTEYYSKLLIKLNFILLYAYKNQI